MAKTCPFAKDYIKAKESLLSASERDDLKGKIDSLETKKRIYNQLVEQGKAISEAYPIIQRIFTTLRSNAPILSKFNLKFVDDDKKTLTFIQGATSMYLDLDKFWDQRNLIEQDKAMAESIQKATQTLNQLSGGAIEMLEEDINILTAKYFKLASEKNNKSAKIDSLKSEEKTWEGTVGLYSEFLEWKATEIERCAKITELEAKLTTYKTNYELCGLLNSKSESYMKELEGLNLKLIPSTTDEINKNRYKMVLFYEYQKEFKEFSEKFGRIETIKKYASPTTGIQTLFMQMYLNNMITTSNKLLSLLFGGNYVLYPFVVNENEFRIPCSGKGLMNDDISSMSTSQICMISMIISFALLHQSSGVYNIVKLDEMDGGLDQENRVQFIVLLRQMMNTLGYEQCIMISHNSELSTADTDVILLRNNDTERIQGNIIYDFREEKEVI